MTYDVWSQLFLFCRRLSAWDGGDVFICLQGPRSNKDNIAPAGYNLGTNVGRKRNAKFKDYLLLSFITESE